MLLRARDALLGTALFCLGCAAPQRTEQHDAALPVEVVAALAADALRAALPDADPQPRHAGAPASRHDDDSYCVSYHQRRDGRWLPRCNGRLSTSVRIEYPPQIRYEPDADMTGCAAPRARLTARIVAGPAGTRWSIAGPSPVADVVRDHVLRGTAYAAALAAGEIHEPCCAAHAGWLAHPFVARAARHLQQGQLAAALAALQSAQASAGNLPGLQQRLGTVAAALGLDEQALPHLREAELLAVDPVARAAITRTLHRIESRRGHDAGAASLRRDALQLLHHGDLHGAAALAHAAEARTPDRIADLGLRHLLMRARGEPEAALGSALLLREYGGLAAASLAADFTSAGHPALARRAAMRRLLGLLPGLPPPSLVGPDTGAVAATPPR